MNTEIATTSPSAAQKPPKPDKPLRISKALRQALNLLASGECKTQKAAAERAGLSEQHMSRMLNRAEIQVFIAQRARKTIAQGVLRASARVIELVDASSEHVSLDASKHILAIEGIKPVEQGTNINITNNIAPGYVIDMRDPRDAATIDVTPRPIANGTD
jgi:hypothetical protein